MVLVASLWLHAIGTPFMAEAQTPEALAARFGAAWEAQDEGAIADLLTSEGVHLRLDADGHGGLPPRRVVAALRSYWADRTEARVSVAKVSTMESQAARAYGELAWRGVDEVTGERFEATIFLGLARGDDGWRIDEIRTMAPR